MAWFKGLSFWQRMFWYFVWVLIISLVDFGCNSIPPPYTYIGSLINSIVGGAAGAVTIESVIQLQKLQQQTRKKLQQTRKKLRQIREKVSRKYDETEDAIEIVGQQH